MTTREALLELAKLSLDAGRNYYRRVGLADLILKDKDWVEAEFRGDVYNAARVLEQQYLHELAGSLSIWQLLEIYSKYPEEVDWKQRKYNLRVLWKDTNVRIPVERKVERITKVQFQALNDTLVEKEFELKRVTKEKREIDGEVVNLRKRVQQLEMENEHLKGRVVELERIVSKRLAV